MGGGEIHNQNIHSNGANQFANDASDVLSAISREEEKTEYLVLTRHDFEAVVKREREEVEDMVKALLRKEHQQQSNHTLSCQGAIEKTTSYQSQNIIKPAEEKATGIFKNPAEEGIPVVYDKQVGFLLVSPQYLSFTRIDNSLVEEWAWKSLDRVTANAAMRITHCDTKKKSLFFEFKNRTALKTAAADFRSRIGEARASCAGAIAEAPEQSTANDEIKSLLASTKMKPISTRQNGRETGNSRDNMRGEDLMALMQSVIENHHSANQEKAGMLHAPFGEDVYTLLYMQKFWSQSFWYGLFVYALQITLIILAFVDLIDAGASTNSLDIPPMVGLAVSCAQAITILFSLAYQTDLTETIVKLTDGFHPELLHEYPGATFSKWLFSCLAQLVTGLMLLSAMLILTMRAETVIDVMLNFTALQTLAAIDNLGFSMAKLGFITDQAQAEVESVVRVKVTKREGRNRCRQVLYFLALVGLCVGYGILKKTQFDGTYLPTYVFVQFGDGFNFRIGFYSGVLTSGVGSTSAVRRKYRDTVNGNILLLSYCEEEKSWTFSETEDPCNYFAKSSVTGTYDVASIPDADWQVLDSTERLQPFDSFSLVRQDCNPKTCQGTCGDDGLCKCSHDRFGLECELPNACRELHVDERLSPFPAITIPSGEGGELEFSAPSDEFQMLKNPATGEYIRVYNMPVYYSNKTHPANILFFGGWRWILSTEWDLFNLTKAREENPAKAFFLEETVTTLENSFHGYHRAHYTPFFMSDPVDFETPGVQATPDGLRWWKAVKEDNETRHFVPGERVYTSIVCRSSSASCLGQADDFCGIGSCSKDTGVCECPAFWGVSGSRCEMQDDCYDYGGHCGTNGVCDESSGHCRCNLPYYGKLCHLTYKCYEEGGQCQNGGMCNVITGECDCPQDDPAISGVACEKRADCAVFGCANGGLCGFNGECICPSPFYGTHCDLVNATMEEYFCSKDNDCNDGTCNASTGFCTCKDPASHGILCEHQYNCSDVHALSFFGRDPAYCLNDGICNATTGLCDCPEPFFGPDCSQFPPCLSDDDCGMTGLGACDVDTGKCSCLLGIASGKKCQEPIFITCSDDDDCHKTGECHNEICRCILGFSGTLCESLVVGMYDSLLDELQNDLEAAVQHCGSFNLTDDCFVEDDYSGRKLRHEDSQDMLGIPMENG